MSFPAREVLAPERSTWLQGACTHPGRLLHDRPHDGSHCQHACGGARTSRVAALAVRQASGEGGRAHVHRMRAHRQCVHRCSQGAQCGRTRCRARTQSAGPRHCNTTVPATQAATLQRDTQQRVQQTHQAAHVPSAITPQHLRCLPFELSTEQRGSRRKLRGLDDVRHIAHAVSPGAHRRRTVSSRAGLTPRALRANPACMRPPSACALQRAPSGQLKCN